MLIIKHLSPSPARLWRTRLIYAAHKLRPLKRRGPLSLGACSGEKRLEKNARETTANREKYAAIFCAALAFYYDVWPIRLTTRHPASPVK